MLRMSVRRGFWLTLGLQERRCHWTVGMRAKAGKRQVKILKSEVCWLMRS